MKKIRINIRVFSIFICCSFLYACVPKVQYSDPLSAIGASTENNNFSQLTLGVVFSENTKKSVEHIEESRSLVSNILASPLAREDLDPSFLTKGINGLLVQRFNKVVVYDSLKIAKKSNNDILMILDIKADVGFFSFSETSVIISGIFFDKYEKKIVNIESEGIKTVPYPASSLQFKPAAEIALNSFANQLDQSQKLAEAAKFSKGSGRKNNQYSSAQGKSKLTVITNPNGAKIRILNIGPKYRDGINLQPGKYHIEVTKLGYKKFLTWLTLDSENKVFDVVLKQLPKNNGSLGNNEAINISAPSRHDSASGEKQRRTALVIGNSKYEFSPLSNPANDARDMAGLLKKLGFVVTLKINANQEQMEGAINNFGKKLSAGGVGLFYYAGHGVQMNGQNYLIPVGSKIKRQKDVRYKAVNVGQVLDEMGYAGNGFNIAILDACRDNPLPKSFRSSARGLTRVNSPEGTLIAFSTSPGSTAADGEGRNGLYTKYLLKFMKTPGISVEEVLKRVSRSVKNETHKKQSPWMESSFSGDFYFIP